VEDLPIRTGWVVYNPAASKVVEYPTYVQTAKWARDINEGKAVAVGVDPSQSARLGTLW